MRYRMRGWFDMPLPVHIDDSNSALEFIMKSVSVVMMVIVSCAEKSHL